MKIMLFTIPFTSLSCFAQAQFRPIDSLNKAFALATNDDVRCQLIGFITNTYTFSNLDSALLYSRKGILLAQKMKSDLCLSYALSSYGAVLTQMGNYAQAIYFELEGLKLAEKNNDYNNLGWCYSNLV